MDAYATRGQEVVEFFVFEYAYGARLVVELGGVENNQVIGVGYIGGEREAQGAAVEIGGVGQLVRVLEVAHGVNACAFVGEQDVTYA